MEKLDTNKRLLLAIVLSFLVLTLYGYLFPPENEKNMAKNNQNNNVTTHQTKAAPAPVTTQAPTQTKVTKAPSAPKSTTATIANIETNKYKATIDNLGRIHSLILKEKKYKDENGNPIDLINKKLIKPLELRFKDVALNAKAFQTNYSASTKELNATNKSASLTLTQNLGDIIVKKIITFHPKGNYDIKVEVSDKTKEFFITPGFRPTVDKTMYMVVRGVLIRDDKGVLTTLEKGDVKSILTFPNTTVAAGVDRYYTTLFYKKEGIFPTTVAACGSECVGYEEEPIAFVHAKGELNLQGYAGPKEWKLFESLDPKLTDVIEFGWFTFLAKPFFKVMLAIYDFVGNWGWTIVIFTILVKLVLFPLSYKGLMSMQKLKDLAPKMKELREKYKNDPAKMNQQMMALYKKHGANPMGGCLPMLLQIPIFFALYRVLLNADELQGAPWILWIKDLSAPDPYFVLPVLMGLTMYIQQKITPNTMTDPMQQKIFMWLPAIMTIFFINFPSGLVLYWLVNNILTILQQLYINKAYQKYREQQKLKLKEKPKAKEIKNKKNK